MTKSLFAAPASLVLAGCSAFGLRTAEEPSYAILEKDGAIEVRQYDAILLAETIVEGAYGSASNQAFGRLAGYIFGNNEAEQEMEMTAPVLQETGEEISMTAPVLQQPSGESWRMGFVMPAGFTLETLPQPSDSRIALRSVPARKVASIRYSGFLTENAIAEHARELQEWLAQHDHQSISAPRSAAYDPPWTIPFLRRNEVHIDVE